MDPAPKLDPMTETALRSLHDIALPPPVSWMPQTWGWGMLAVIAAALLLLWVYLALRRFRRNAYRREALWRLDEIKRDMAETGAREQAVQAVAELLKRTALAAWPRAQIAAMTGSAWARFLDNAGPADKAVDQVLDDLEYRSDTGLSSLTSAIADDAVIGARRWIEKHHVST